VLGIFSLPTCITPYWKPSYTHLPSLPIAWRAPAWAAAHPTHRRPSAFLGGFKNHQPRSEEAVRGRGESLLGLRGHRGFERVGSFREEDPREALRAWKTSKEPGTSGRKIVLTHHGSWPQALRWCPALREGFRARQGTPLAPGRAAERDRHRPRKEHTPSASPQRKPRRDGWR